MRKENPLMTSRGVKQSQAKLRILIVDDHQVVRDGLKLLINRQPDMEVADEAADGRSAATKAKELQPDIAIMDVSMPGMNGLDATKHLKKICPNVRIITLTRHAETGYLQQLLSAGASGYVLKQSSSSELIRAVRAVASGDSYIDPAITDKLIGSYLNRQTSEGSKSSGVLSEREEEVLRLIAWGYSNKEIAAKLQISVKTVEAHKANASRKLGLTSRIGIVRYALLRGWLKDG